MNIDIIQQEVKHKQKSKLCFLCNEIHDKINTFNMRERNYLSNFYDMEFSMQLCDNCSSESDIQLDWFDNEISKIKETNEYVNERYIIELIELFPICNQEYIYNCDVVCDGFIDEKLDRCEWIKIHT